jgi:hypothetical protein
MLVTIRVKLEVPEDPENPDVRARQDLLDPVGFRESPESGENVENLE